MSEGLRKETYIPRLKLGSENVVDRYLKSEIDHGHDQEEDKEQPHIENKKIHCVNTRQKKTHNRIT